MFFLFFTKDKKKKTKKSSKSKKSKKHKRARSSSSSTSSSSSSTKHNKSKKHHKKDSSSSSSADAAAPGRPYSGKYYTADQLPSYVTTYASLPILAVMEALHIVDAARRSQHHFQIQPVSFRMANNARAMTYQGWFHQVVGCFCFSPSLQSWSCFLFPSSVSASLPGPNHDNTYPASVEGTAERHCSASPLTQVLPSTATHW
jgi:hypothetical protein